MAASKKSSEQINKFIDTKYVSLDKKVKAAVFIAACVVPVALFYFLYYSPNVEKINSLSSKKAALITEVSKAKNAEKDLIKIKEDIAKTEEIFKQTAIVLPKTKEIPTLLRNISDLGKGAGLDFITFKPGAEIPKDFYAEIPVDITIKGPYHNLGYFLDQVSKLERIVTVDNINMGGAKKEGGELLLNSKCRLTTYRFTGIQQQQTPQKGKKGRRG
ncbi:MAG: type 4a pilus biogenesis protein PilO [Desulfobulbaceae bacterium]|nr:type 4a pilus biogenesis protein PilO [Desulfobulbaceae bacterium]